MGHLIRDLKPLIEKKMQVANILEYQGSFIVTFLRPIQ